MLSELTEALNDESSTGTIGSNAILTTLEPFPPTITVSEPIKAAPITWLWTTFNKPTLICVHVPPSFVV